jgi:hypothetical protein
MYIGGNYPILCNVFIRGLKMIVKILRDTKQGGVIFVKSTEPSDNAMEYIEAIRQAFDSIDSWRYPAIEHYTNDKGEAVAKITYKTI